jgi:hypothetical protein
MQVPIPLIPRSHKLPIDVVESSDKTRTLDDAWIRSTCITKPIARPCVGVHLVMPDGVLLYSVYPFMLHEQFVLPWNIHVVDH